MIKNIVQNKNEKLLKTFSKLIHKCSKISKNAEKSKKTSELKLINDKAKIKELDDLIDYLENTKNEFRKIYDKIF